MSIGSSSPSPFKLVLSQRSILDTLFVCQTPRRPAYATTTDGSVTTLWCIDVRGNMSEVAQILWQYHSPNSRQSRAVVINGQTMLVDDVLQRSKSFFGSNSRIFAAGDMRFKWKRGPTSGLYAGTEQHRSLHGPTYTSPAASQVWTCYETTAAVPGFSSAGFSSSAASTSVVALFFPPQIGLIKSELTIYPKGEVIIDHVVLTALLICASKDEWRSAQSAITRAALEASLKAEIRGSLPPYIPVASARSRVKSSRRPHTAHAAGSQYSSPRAPPPYSSAGGTYLRLR